MDFTTFSAGLYAGLFLAALLSRIKLAPTFAIAIFGFVAIVLALSQFLRI